MTVPIGFAGCAGGFLGRPTRACPAWPTPRRAIVRRAAWSCRCARRAGVSERRRPFSMARCPIALNDMGNPLPVVFGPVSVCAGVLRLVLWSMLVLVQLHLSLLVAVFGLRCCGLCRVAAAARVPCIVLWLLLHLGYARCRRLGWWLLVWLCILGVFVRGLALALERALLASDAASSCVRLAAAATLSRYAVTASSLSLRLTVGFPLVGCVCVGALACCCSRLAFGWLGFRSWCGAVVGVGVAWACTVLRAASAPRAMLPWMAFAAVRNLSSMTRRCTASFVTVLKSLAKSRTQLNCVNSLDGRGATPSRALATWTTNTCSFLNVTCVCSVVSVSASMPVSSFISLAAVWSAVSPGLRFPPKSCQ